MGINEFIVNLVKKAEKIAWKLRKIRNLNKLRLNINLFRIMVMSSARMGMINVRKLGATAKMKFTGCIKKLFKKFVKIPKTVENEIIELMMGNVDKMAVEVESMAEAKIVRREGGS